jgi:hypothetical protein
MPLLEDVGAEVEARLRRRWPVIDRVATELLRRQRLSGAEVRKLLDQPA